MKKDFDAVAFQRQIRLKLGKEYLKDRKEFLRMLKDNQEIKLKKAA